MQLQWKCWTCSYLADENANQAGVEVSLDQSEVISDIEHGSDKREEIS